jgi:hypothetical protein
MIRAGQLRFVSVFACCLVFRLAARAGQAPGFFGGDLAIVGQPYALDLPSGAECEVAWGDGAVETIPAAATAGRRVSHAYANAGVADVSARVRSGPGAKWRPLPLDAAAIVRAARPAFELADPGAAPVTLARVLAAPADLFSFECRVRLDAPAGAVGAAAAADQVLLASAEEGPGACRFGLRGQTLYFELAGAGGCSSAVANPLEPGRWHHLAVTYDRARLFPRAGRVRFFVDGAPVGERTIDAVDAGSARCGRATLGGPGFRGTIERAAIYDRLLFPLEVSDHARALAGQTTLGVTIAYPGAPSAGATADLPAIVRTVDVPLDAGPHADNGPALRKAIAAAGPGTRLRLVGPDGAAAAGRYFVRSLVEANRWAAMVVEDKTDLELDGNGATLVFADKSARYLYVDRCRRVAVRNLSFDLDPAYARVALYAKLLEVDPATRTVRAQLVNARDGSPDPSIPRRATYWRWRPHDPRTLRATAGAALFDSSGYAQRPTADPAAGPGALRLTLKQPPDHKLWRQLKAELAGDNFFLINNADFGSNAVSLDRSSHVTFDGVKYFATLGMVFLASGSDHVRVTRCAIGLPPGLTAADRPLAAGADGYHFHQMTGPVVFDHNDVALTDDDPISLKDDVWPNVGRASDRELKIGKPPFHPGSTIELLKPDYAPTGYRATVIGSPRAGVVAVDRPLPDRIDPGSIVMDRSHNTAGWVIRDNAFHDFYGRVMLYTDHGTFAGNRVHDGLYHLGNSTAYFETAGACRNVITRGNFFEQTTADCAHWGGDRRLASFHELTFAGNSFWGKPLTLNTAADALVARNAFYDPGPGPGPGAAAATTAAVTLRRCARAAVLDNAAFTADGRPAALAVDRREGQDVTERGNTGAAPPAPPTTAR